MLKMITPTEALDLTPDMISFLETAGDGGQVVTREHVTRYMIHRLYGFSQNTSAKYWETPEMDMNPHQYLADVLMVTDQGLKGTDYVLELWRLMTNLVLWDAQLAAEHGWRKLEIGLRRFREFNFAQPNV